MSNTPILNVYATRIYRLNQHKEDVNKILNEINQILNQRFQLTISAITVFGVFIALAIPKDLGPNQLPKSTTEFLFAAPILLLIFLFLLFLYAHYLNRMINILSTYLRVNRKSKWENDFVIFRGRKGVGYSRIEHIISLLLGIITSSFPFILCYVTGLNYPASPMAVNLLIHSGILYMIIILRLSLLNLGHSEKRIEDKWKRLKKKGKI